MLFYKKFKIKKLRWQKEKKTYPKEIYEVPGMINQQERELFNLAKEVYTGKGREIVEVGHCLELHLQV